MSLVAELDGEVVGQVAFSPITIGGVDCKWYALGPVAVARRHQRCGIGSKLIEAGLEALRSLGASGCVLVGEPGFYSRFGFRHDPNLVMEGIPPQYFMSLPLADHRPRGRVEHHPAFSI